MEYKILYEWGKYISTDYDTLLELVKTEGTADIETITKCRLGEYEYKYIAKFYYTRNA